MASKNSKQNSVKTTWDLGLLYKSPNDPKIEEDVKATEEACLLFEKKYKGRDDYFLNDESLLEALKAFETLYATFAGSRPLMYFSYMQALDSANPIVESNLNRITHRVTAAYNRIIFFELLLGGLAEERKEASLKSDMLSPYRYYLSRVYLESKYHLKESEEKILNLKNLPSNTMWVNGFEKILGKEDVRFKGKTIPLPEAQFKISNVGTADRRILQKELNRVYKKVSDVAELEINAIYTNKKIDDELRGFQMPYSATILGYQNDEESILKLVKTVTADFAVSHRFYKLKAKLLKLPYLSYVDRAAPVGSLKRTIGFPDALGMVRRAFDSVNPDYRKILDTFLANGQIDVYPKKGKTGGAFCSSTIGSPTYVFLNHVDSADSMMTFAHEMGHAIHATRSKSQQPFYEGHSISTAEVASTLFENFAFEEFLKTLNEKEKVIALHDRINDDVQTIFRQIACFNFELDLHTLIRTEGNASKEKIAELMNKHMKAYLGPIFKLHPDDGYMFVAWGHIRRFFYVYSYAYGQLISKALYKRLKEDKNFISQIDKFLSAGGSMSPEDIFKNIGIDVSDPSFFKEGLKSIVEDIDRLEKLMKK